MSLTCTPFDSSNIQWHLLPQNLFPEHSHLGQVKITFRYKCLINMLLLLHLLEFYSVVLMNLYFLFIHIKVRILQRVFLKGFLMIQG